jgi:hypothetical protein
MAQVTGTTWTGATSSAGSYGSNIYEDVEDIIHELDPMDTWALTNLDKVDADAIYHTWLADDLAAPGTNIQIEGDDATFSTASAAPRYGNILQIVSKTFVVSETLEAVRKIGRSSESGRLGTKLMKELKRDMEYALVRNQASSLGGSATGRSMAGMESWISGTAVTANALGNVVLATTSASATTPGFSGGTVAAPTDGGTTGALTVGPLNSALGGAWEDGGNATEILVDAQNKQTIDGFTGIATRMVDSAPNKQAVIIGAANVYVSSYGTHTIRLSRYVRHAAVMCIDPEYWAIAYLRRPRVEQLAKTGDAKKKLLVAELTLVCRNPRASAKVVAVT